MNIYSSEQPWKTLLVSELVELYLGDCRARRLSKATLETYDFYLRWLLDWCSNVGIEDVEELDAQMLRNFVLFMQAPGPRGKRSPFTVHCGFRVLRSFFIFLVNEEVLDTNPTKKLKAPRLPKQVLPALTPDEVQRIVDHWSRWESKPRNQRTGLDMFELRNLALFYFLLDTGLRVQEASNVLLRDVDFKSGRVFVRCGKGAKDRVSFMGKTTLRYVREYMRLLPADAGRHLWYGQYGELSADGIQTIFKRLARELGIQVSPHKIRRTFAISMLRNGADLYRLKELMGHSDLRTLERYLELNEDDLAKVHQISGPVERRTKSYCQV